MLSISTRAKQPPARSLARPFPRRARDGRRRPKKLAPLFFSVFCAAPENCRFGATARLCTKRMSGRASERVGGRAEAPIEAAKPLINANVASERRSLFARALCDQHFYLRNAAPLQRRLDLIQLRRSPKLVPSSLIFAWTRRRLNLLASLNRGGGAHEKRYGGRRRASPIARAQFAPPSRAQVLISPRGRRRHHRRD